MKRLTPEQLVALTPQQRAWRVEAEKANAAAVGLWYQFWVRVRRWKVELRGDRVRFTMTKRQTWQAEIFSWFPGSHALTVRFTCYGGPPSVYVSSHTRLRYFGSYRFGTKDLKHVPVLIRQLKAQSSPYYKTVVTLRPAGRPPQFPAADLPADGTGTNHPIAYDHARLCWVSSDSEDSADADADH